LLVLSTIGRIAVCWSRPIEDTPKRVTISHEVDGWYACFSCDGVPIQPLPATGQETDIDLGLESFATLADGSQIATPRLFRVAERALKRAQRRVSRRVKGSHRRRKAVRLLARAQQKVRRARRDFHHKVALSLVRRQYDTIYQEDLQTASLLRNHHLAKSIADAGWSAFLSILACKAVCAGKRAVAVAACLYEPAVLWLWRDHPQGPLRPLARVPGLRDEPAPERKRRQEHRMGRAGPWGSRGVGRGEEPRIARIHAGECQI
jgi:putative transposase